MMRKLSEQEREELRERANKIHSCEREKKEKIIAELDEDRRNFLEYNGYRGSVTDCALWKELKSGIISGKYKKPSEFFESECEWLFGGIIYQCHKASFLYAVDRCIDFPYTEGWTRRPFRSESYLSYFNRISGIIYVYKNMNCAKTLEQAIIGDLTEDEELYFSYFKYSNQYDIAFGIDSGSEAVINWVREAIESGGDITYEVLRGVFMSGNTELYELVGKLLIAARLQEGLRQAICETCDEGTREAHYTIIRVISENDLIRFSSVKRAVGTWTGLMALSVPDLERISKKTIGLIESCIADEDFRNECLDSDDAMKIYIGIWSIANKCLESAVEKIKDIAVNGTHQQQITAALFARETQVEVHELSKMMLLAHPEEKDIAAICVPVLISNSDYWNRNVDHSKDIEYYFASRDEAEKVYDILLAHYNSLDKKSVDFQPCVFPFNNESLTRSDLIRKLARICYMLDDNDKTDEICQHLADIDVSGYSSRSSEVYMLLSEPKTPLQKKVLVAECADRETSARDTAFSIIETMSLEPEHFRQLEDMLRYKAADIRSKIIKILLKMNDDELYGCVKRLLSDKKEEKRTAGLDIIIQLSKDTERSGIFDRCLELVEAISSPTSKEKILIDQLRTDKSSGDMPYGWGLFSENDSYSPVWDEEYIESARALFGEYFPGSKIIGGEPVYDIEPVLRKLSDLIEEHKNDEYTNRFDEKALLGSASASLTYYGTNVEKEIAFDDMWLKFYSENINDKRLMMRLYIAIDLISSSDDDFRKPLFGREFSELPAIAYMNQIKQIILFLYLKNKDVDIQYKLSCALTEYLAVRAKDDELICITPNNSSYKYTNYYVKDGKLVETTDNIKYVGAGLSLLHMLGYPEDKKKFALSFALNMKLAERMGFYVISADERVRKNEIRTYNIEKAEPPISILFVRAAYEGVITEGFMYRYFMEIKINREDVITALSSLVMEYRESEKKQSARKLLGYYYRGRDMVAKLLCTDTVNDDNRALVEYAIGIYERLAELILSSELCRGDSAAEFSDCITGFQRIYGLELFVKILAAMGRDTLDRSTWSIGREPSRKESFSHLLAVCVPGEGDDAEKLGKLISGTDITEKRLVEAALFAPQWIDIVSSYLGWEGFRSACYYFMAHMNEQFGDDITAVIAKYTPISVEDLNDGAFDINWFREAYDEIGEKRFNMIYDAAKYISDGAKHSRARKYADAVMGKFSIDEAVKSITEKRNKDSVMAYALIPLKGEDDIFGRYMLLKKFQKESKQFGAQRRASEGKTVDIAMQNLAVNAGFEDVTRLTLRMETRLFDDIRPMTEPVSVGEVTLQLVIDDDGAASVECKKAGKILKSIPAKLKKDETVLRFADVKKQLTEQYRRTRSMFEQAMEDEVIFRAGEIEALLTNPVAAPIVSRIVFKNGDSLGFFKDMALNSPDGVSAKLNAESEIVAAHPFDLYKSGKWHEFQKYLFENHIIQPFRQVFRELYVKTDDERDKFNTMRYSGNQINPKQTVGCLKSRRWVADVEDGLQKVYYKENIIARIYALADWFSPADIEAPTLEWVEFSDRRTGEAIKIADIPDIIFSEVMRDVDLAVSVAHAGGVDPETSHSTIEMRRALCEFTIPLFKLDNVRFERSHAFITGERADYSIHLGSGVVHIQGGTMINILPVHSQHRGKIFLPFADEDPKTAQIISEILLFAEDQKIKDPFILDQIGR